MLLRKKISLALLSVSALLTVSTTSVFAQKCKAKPLIKQYKPTMKPFSLDSYNETIVDYGKKAQKQEVQFTAYTGELYKLMFCGNGLPQEVKISVYDKNFKAKTRKELYSNVLKAGDNVTEAFETVKAGNYYIDYEAPASVDTSEVLKGCIITLIGFREKE